MGETKVEGRVGVFRIEFRDAGESRHGGFDLAQVQVENGARIEGAGLVGLDLEDVGEDVEGEAFVPILLSVQRGDG